MVLNTTGYGVDFEPSAASQLYINNSSFRFNTQGEVLIKPGASGSATVVMEKVRMEKGTYGLRVEDRSRVSVRDSYAAGMANSGFIAVSASGAIEMNLENCVSTFNGANGLKSSGSASIVRISNSTFTNNQGYGVSSAMSGQVLSFQQNGGGTNNISGNGVDGGPTGSIARQ